MKNIVLFGASNYGSLVYSYMENKEKVIYFCDNSPKKWGKDFCGLKVISPKELLSIKDVRLIITSQYELQITKQLFELGFRKLEIARMVVDGKSKETKVRFDKYDYSEVKDLEIVKNRICLVSTNTSGSNTYALYKLVPEKFKENYDLKLLDGNNKNIEYYLNMITCNMIIGTYGPIHYSPEKASLELWHGFPLKSLGSMISNSEEHDDFTRIEWSKINKVASYSQLYNTAMSASYGIHANQYSITGMPRNDFLFISKGKQKLEEILGQRIQNKKIILFMPTFRESVEKHEREIVKELGNIFGFEDFDKISFNQFLKKENIALVVKLHPFEEQIVLNKLEEFTGEDIHILTQDTLIKSGHDLYELLNAADMLITDYSSVYFDYLLLNRPILFTPIDLEHYRNTRGFLFEPYDFWAPGPKCCSFNDLEREITKLLDNPDYFSVERETVRRIVHHYNDGYASERLWKIIDQLMQTN